MRIFLKKKGRALWIFVLILESISMLVLPNMSAYYASGSGTDYVSWREASGGTYEYGSDKTVTSYSVMSDWARNELGGADIYDIFKTDAFLDPAAEPYDTEYRFAVSGYKSPITRWQMTMYVTNIFMKLMSPESAKNLRDRYLVRYDEISAQPFTDVEQFTVFYKPVTYAWENGLAAGIGNGRFEPEGILNRAQAVTFISNALKKLYSADMAPSAEATEQLRAFRDYAEIPEWAKESAALVLELGAISGIDGAFMPNEPCTEEQAMAFVQRTYKKLERADVLANYEAQYASYMSSHAGMPVGALSGVSDWSTLDILSSTSLEWSGASNEQFYMVDIVNASTGRVLSYPTTAGAVTLGAGGIPISAPGDFTLSVRGASGGESATLHVNTACYPSDNEETGWHETPPLDVPIPPGEAGSAKYPLSDAELVLPKSASEFRQDAEKVAAAKALYNSGGHLTTVTVPVWRLKSDGTKTEGTASLKINSVVANDVVAIFTEIFNGSERFPIHDAGGYRSSSNAEHGWGLAIDINWDENYYINWKSGATSGSHYNPGFDPYSIPSGGDVVRAFARYGWYWGGVGWSTNADYMHFSLTGR